MDLDLLYGRLSTDVVSLSTKSQISDTHIVAPRIGGSRDKKTRIAKELALKLFPEDQTDLSKRTHSYIRYSKLLRDLKQEYLKQHPPIAPPPKSCGCSTKYPQYKEARINGNLEKYDKLLQEPPGDPVTHPSAMPVEIAPLDELQPFFSYLETNKSPVAMYNDKNGEYISFKRGAFYTDGRIDLCKQVVGPTWITNLMESIKMNPYIRHFLLGNNIIGFEGAKAIGKFLEDAKRKCHIETWYLAGNDLDEKGIGYISRPLSDDETCLSLWLKRNPLHPRGISQIGKMLETNSSIQTLDLDNTACFDEGVKYLFESLAKNKTLKYLYLDSNAITDARPITCYFQTLINSKSRGVSNLTLGINRLGDNGVIELVDVLKNYGYLERLVLSSNRIGLKGLKVLLESLKNHPSLVILDIGMYKSTPDMAELPNNFCKGGQIIADFITDNDKLKMLDVSSSHLCEDDLELICTAVEKNKTLIYVHASQYGLKTPRSRSILKQISDYCKRNIMEQELDYAQTMKDIRYYKHLPSVRLIDSIYRNNM